MSYSNERSLECFLSIEGFQMGRPLRGHLSIEDLKRFFHK